MTTPNIFSIEHAWGLPRNVSPRFGARLILRGTHLDFLSDRASFVGTFEPEIRERLNQMFPELIKQLEAKVLSGKIDPRQQQSITIEHDGFTCEADSLGSHGYLYIAIYQATNNSIHTNLLSTQ
jgi:cytoskeleton bundling-enhancing protein CbeA-like protein